MWTTQRFRRICFIVVIMNSLFGALSAYVWPSHAYVMFVAMCIHTYVHAQMCIWPVGARYYSCCSCCFDFCCIYAVICLLLAHLKCFHVMPSHPQLSERRWNLTAALPRSLPPILTGIAYACMCMFIPTYLHTYIHTCISTLIPIYRHAHTRRLIVANAISFKSTHRYLANIST